MATINQVRKAFDDERQAISALDKDLAAERAAIKYKTFQERRSPSKAEVERRKEIVATRQKLSDAFRTLALDTVDALENANDVEALLAEINTINQQLTDDLAQLKDIVEHAEKAAQVATGLANITRKLADLANKIV